MRAPIGSGPSNIGTACNGRHETLAIVWLASARKTEMAIELPSHLRDTARALAQHEMGHYVVGRVLGYRTGEVSIELVDWNHYRGGAAIFLAEGLRGGSVRDYLERRVQVLYAGAQAQTLRRNLPDSKVDEEAAIEIIENPTQGAEQDHAKTRELINIIRNIRHPNTPLPNDDEVNQQLKVISNDLWGRTKDLVDAHANVIVGLAQNLSDRVKRTKQLVQISADELQDLPAVLALSQVHVR